MLSATLPFNLKTKWKLSLLLILPYWSQKSRMLRLERQLDLLLRNSSTNVFICNLKLQLHQVIILLVLILYFCELYMVCLQGVPDPSSMGNCVLCIGLCIGLNLSLSFYQVLPNFPSLAEHYQIILTAENYGLESDLHQIAHSYW